MRSILSIAGSDSCGGAGIQADIKTASALGVYCCTAITAVTAQNPDYIIRADYVGDRALDAQLEAVLESIRPDAVKIGMLPCASAVRVAARKVREYELANVVFDPVLSATCGESLSGGDGREREETIDALLEDLLPLTTLVTPNTLEMLELSRNEFLGNYESAAAHLSAYNKKAFLLKGGHNEEHPCIDILYHIDELHDCVTKASYPGTKIETRHTHGTGCTLSTAIACYLAQGYSLTDAVRKAKAFVTMCIEKGTDTGLFDKNGPVIQF